MCLNKTITFLIAATACCGLSCHKSDVAHTGTGSSFEDSSLAFLTYDVTGTNAQVSFAFPNIYLRFPDSVSAPGNLAASFSVPTNDVVSVAGRVQVSGVTENNFDLSLIYTIRDQDSDSSQWEIVGTNNDYTLSWGLGQWLQLWRSNNRDYSWYIDQATTGTCSMTNCGPTCATMAMIWSDSTFAKSTIDARAYYKDSCQDWNNNLVGIYLATDSVPFSLAPIGDSAAQMRDLFKAQIDSGRIVIIALGMGSIPFSTTGSASNSRVDQFLPGAGDHYIILKGYRQTNLDFFFEVYDPWNFSQAYSDGTPKGENRFYRYTNIWYGILSDGGGAQVAVSKRW